MKKGYFSGLNKSFGIFPIILLALAFFSVFYLAGGNLFAAEAQLVKNIMSNLGYALFIGIALVGFVGLKDDEIDFIDLIRPAGILGGIGAALFAFLSDKSTIGLIIYASCAGVLLIQFIIRLFKKEYEVGVTGYKSYFSKVSSIFNPLCVLFIAALFTVLVYIFRSKIVTTQIDEYVITYASAVGFGLLIMSVLFALTGLKKANFLDVLLEIIFLGSFMSLIYAIFTLQVFKPVLILCVLSLAALLIRGATFKTEKATLRGIKFNRYFADLASKIDLIAIFVMAVITVGLFVIPSFRGLSLVTQTINALDITFTENLKMILAYVSVGLVAVMVLFLFIVRNITNPEIKTIDFFVSVLLHVGFLAIPLVGWVVVETSTFSLNGVLANIYQLITVIALGVAFLLGLILTFVRIKFYQGIEAQVEEFDKIRDGEKTQEQLEEKEETAEEVEQPVEETQEEIQEQPVEETQEETAEEVEQPVEETQEQPVEETQVETQEETQEQPEDQEETAEEVVYVDEAGNPVEAPAEGEEVTEEIVYIDEDGNPVEAPAVGDEVIEEIVYVDENGNPVEPPAEGEEVTEKIVYVDEDGNEVPEESLEDEDEEDDEDDEDELTEDEEFDAAIAAINDAPANKPAIVVEDFRPVDENGNVKKIKRKFNARMMYASEEAKNYYNEIKNYLVMYRAKGRYSSRCETFRYKGLVAKVALAGKSIKVCLAIDPSSLVDTKYHFKDVSAKKQYAEVPTMIKVRSDRGLKHFKELVDMMMGARGVKVKRNFEPTDYTKSLIPNGEAILGTLGYSVDYLYNTMNVDSIPEELPDDLEQYLPKIMGDSLEEERVEAPIYLDTLCNHFVDGDEITIDVLKTLHVVTRGNVLKIKARGTLDRKLTIYADEFEPDAVKMLLCTNCTAVKIIRPEDLED